jgi:excisionase family DNA binding protein
MFQESPPVKMLLTIDEAAAALNIGRSYVYELVMRRQIKSLKLGRKRRIPITALDEFVMRQLSGEG